MKISAKAYLHAVKYSWNDETEYQIYSCQLEDTEYRVFIKEFDVVDIEVADDFDPTAKQIAALEAQKVKARADFAKSIADIEERIKKLQAIEFTA